MLAVVLDALEHAARPVRQRAVDAVDQQLGIAEDRVQRRAQLVAHIGEELRFVLAGERQLLALVGDLAEQARVLDRQYRLAGQGLHQPHRLRREFARPLAASGSWPRGCARRRPTARSAPSESRRRGWRRAAACSAARARSAIWIGMRRAAASPIAVSVSATCRSRTECASASSQPTASTSRKARSARL